MRTLPLLSTAIALLALPATASAIPTYHPPTPASLLDSRPLVSWTPNPGEAVASVTISSSPNVTPEGEFFSENQVDFGIPSDGVTQYQPTSRIAAGTYWWNTRWTFEDADTFESAYSPAASFTIPVQVRAHGATISQYTYSADMVTVAYTTNTKRVDVACLVFHGRRRIARGVASPNTYNLIGRRSSSTCNRVNVGRGYAGKRLKLVGEVRAGGKLVKVSRFFVGKRG